MASSFPVMRADGGSLWLRVGARVSPESQFLNQGVDFSCNGVYNDTKQ